MKILENMNGCTGCNACFNACPKSAIEMVSNDEGFWYPEIDENKCIDCGLCKKVCPINNAKYDNFAEPECYAVMGDDELRKKSSSGGAFSYFAENILKQNGVVCGAAFAEDWSVRHIIVDNSEDLQKLRGSKYVQSNTTDCYKRIKEYLNNDVKVLFSGTSCQVAGLKSFLGKEYNNLYCVDIICHGVPSPKVFQKALKEKVEGENIENISFRDKMFGWTTTYYINVKTDKSNNVYTGKNFPHVYSFLKNCNLRLCCGDCKFNRLPRQGDITIGDFWGVDDYNQNLNDGKGTSVVVINSEKGKNLFEEIKNNTKLYEKIPLQAIEKRNYNLVKSSEHSEHRDMFFKNLDKMSLQDNIDKIDQNKYDVAILNYWPYSNFGSIITGYALQKSLDELGYSNRLIWYMNNANIRHKVETFNNSHFKYFADRYMNYTSLITDKDLIKINEQTDTVIVGSDQVWKSPGQGINKGAYYLNFVTDSSKKIACAASFGEEKFVGTVEEEALASVLLKQFDAISVREEAGKKICKEKMGVDAEVVIDPVFYIDRKYYDEMADSVKPNLPEKYILAYFLGKDAFDEKVIEHYSDTMNLPVVYLNIKDMNTEEWLHYIRGAELLITNSFHGTCFSVIFGNEFLCVANKNKAYSRFETILSKLNLMDRARPSQEIVLSEKYELEKIDYVKVNELIAKEKEIALNWLINAIKAPKKAEVSPENIVIKKLTNDIMSIYDAVSVRDDLESQTDRLMDILGYEYNLKKYKKYRFLSKVTFGKLHKKYKGKAKALKPKLKIVKQFIKSKRKDGLWKDVN